MGATALGPRAIIWQTDGNHAGRPQSGRLAARQWPRAPPRGLAA